MKLRNWQQEVIDSFPTTIRKHKRFILKAPTGAGKTVLASELIERFYKNKKVIVLCHRLVLLEQLEAALSKKHSVRKLKLSDTSFAFDDCDILLSTNMRAKEILDAAVPAADLIIVDEAHRVSPNGNSYKRVIDLFLEAGKPNAQFIGLTASPERRTADQRDQLNLAFDAIIDCANIEDLINEKVLVKPIYRAHFVHDLNLAKIDITSGDFPVSTLSDAIIKSSMIDCAMWSYKDERDKVSPKPISAWFCSDVKVAEVTLNKIRDAGISAEIVTAATPIKERMQLLSLHESGELEAMVSVGVLTEGWDNPHCNIIVHLRPTLSKVLWGQSVGRGLRAASQKDKCIIIDVSSNWSTFGPVEKLKWSLWSTRGSHLQFMNRFNWIGEQQDGEDAEDTYLLCKNELPDKMRCSHIYKKNAYADDTCPACGSYAAVDIYKEQKLANTVNEQALHRVFFDRVPKAYERMDPSTWQTLGDTTWRTASDKEKVFLSFCMAFSNVSGDETNSETEYWDAALATEVFIRNYLVKNKIIIKKQENFDLSLIADGMLAGRLIRPLQTHYGISLCGAVFMSASDSEKERKYQKAVRVAERLSMLGCSSRDNLPYFNASEIAA